MKGERSEVLRGLRRRRRGWQADVHWRAVGGEMAYATVVLDRVPQAFGVFAHPEVAAGEPMQVTALSIDERQRRVRLDLIDHREPPSG